VIITAYVSLNYKNSVQITAEDATFVLGNAAHNTTQNTMSLQRASPTLIRLTEVVEALDGLKWPEHSGQEQLCDPLVPGSTYWYLSASPELMAVAGHRLEAHLAGRRP
jgi:hypothetical protein